jgi:hypothetical protein
MSDSDERYIKSVNDFIATAAEELSFSLITSENPEKEREVIFQVGVTLAKLADLYEENGMAELSGGYIIDDLASRSLAIFKALGYNIEI